jgi:hypothetical protein
MFTLMSPNQSVRGPRHGTMAADYAAEAEQRHSSRLRQICGQSYSFSRTALERVREAKRRRRTEMLASSRLVARFRNRPFSGFWGM